MNDNPLQFFGVKLLGLSSLTLHKVVLTLAFLLVLIVLRTVLEWIIRAVTPKSRRLRRSFWVRQAANLFTAALFVLSMLSIWFDDPGRLATGIGLVSAGLAFALQKVVTSFAGYFTIIRSRVFTVGDRITMGGVRGDVISLGFLQTRILEMGQPPPVQSAPPATWVTARQYTGRIVSVTNDKVFDQPVYNLSREFAYLFEEIRIPVKYGSDRHRAERILLDAARPATDEIRRGGEERLREISQRYGVPPEEIVPRVYYRLTDNWLELTLRFLVHDHGVRKIKDQISREILNRFEAAGLEIASSTYDIVGVPPLRLHLEHEEERPASSRPAPASH